MREREREERKKKKKKKKKENNNNNNNNEEEKELSFVLPPGSNQLLGELAEGGESRLGGLSTGKPARLGWRGRGGATGSATLGEGLLWPHPPTASARKDGTRFVSPSNVGDWRGRQQGGRERERGSTKW
ncbi:hypothetical protein TIFTF001_008164 [Ficus carica]|uniref:Uncharacterized protein n=1 Tax=Ficus carica TaxID=3494 RepID=A0AA88A802_FICCA|nr:hypothetical protein TIFTF001_008164 [Ficus carica]